MKLSQIVFSITLFTSTFLFSMKKDNSIIPPLISEECAKQLQYLESLPPKQLRTEIENLASAFARRRASPITSEGYWKEAYIAYAFHTIKQNIEENRGKTLGEILCVGQEVKPTCLFRKWNDEPILPYFRKACNIGQEQRRSIEDDWARICELLNATMQKNLQKPIQHQDLDTPNRTEDTNIKFLSIDEKLQLAEAGHIKHMVFAIQYALSQKNYAEAVHWLSRAKIRQRIDGECHKDPRVVDFTFLLLEVERSPAYSRLNHHTTQAERKQIFQEAITWVQEKLNNDQLPDPYWLDKNTANFFPSSEWQTKRQAMLNNYSGYFKDQK